MKKVLCILGLLLAFAIGFGVSSWRRLQSYQRGFAAGQLAQSQQSEER